MNNFIILDRRKHESFLADHCVDPTTKELLKVGDEVCICANCKSPHFKSVWLMAKLCPSCRNESKRTLSEIPKTNQYTHFPKPLTPIAKNSYKGYFIFFLITTIISDFTCFFFYSETEKWKNNYYYEKSNLNSEITVLSNETSQLSSKNKNLQQQLNESNNALHELKSKLDFKIGIKYNKRTNYNLHYGDYKAKIYFTVNYPIYFKSVKVDADGSGSIYGYIYNTNNDKICKAYNGEITDGVETLDFNNCSLNKGNYYLTHTGNIPLACIDNFNEYPISNNAISITGTQYDSKYYMNFFEWSYKLK